MGNTELDPVPAAPRERISGIEMGRIYTGTVQRHVLQGVEVRILGVWTGFISEAELGNGADGSAARVQIGEEIPLKVLGAYRDATDVFDCSRRAALEEQRRLGVRHVDMADLSLPLQQRIAFQQFLAADDRRERQERKSAEDLAGNQQSARARSGELLQQTAGYRASAQQGWAEAQQTLGWAGLDHYAQPKVAGLLPSGASPVKELARSSSRVDQAASDLRDSVAALQAWHRAKDRPKMIGGLAVVALLTGITGYFFGTPVALLLFPGLLGATIPLLRLLPAITLVNRFVDWVAAKEAEPNQGIRGAALWVMKRIGPWTTGIADPYVRAGTRVAGYFYFVCVLLAVLVSVVAAVIYVVIMVAIAIGVLYGVLKGLQEMD